MAAKKNPKAADVLAKDDLIVIGGAGGFIAGSLARRFHDQGFTRIRAIDKKPLPEWYQRTPGVECLCMDLSQEKNCKRACEGAAEVYNLAADMGGMGFIERFRIECLRSILINTHMIESAWRAGAKRYFFSSSACAYNVELQKSPDVRALKESDAYPAMAERGYGWEKLMSEMFCQEYWAERGLRDAHRPLPQRLRPLGHLGWRPREGPRGDLPQGDRGQGHRPEGHHDLGRRASDPQLHVHRRLRRGHRHDHALRQADRHADQSRVELPGLDQRAGHAGRGDRRHQAQSQVRSRRPQGRRRPQQRQHVHPAGPGLGAEHAAQGRPGEDLRLDRDSSTTTARPANERSS